jgi:hypothetical protein
MSKKMDYAWALECWREMMVKYRAGRPTSSASPKLLSEADEVGCWYDRCTIPHCDCEKRNIARGEA